MSAKNAGRFTVAPPSTATRVRSTSTCVLSVIPLRLREADLESRSQPGYAGTGKEIEAAAASRHSVDTLEPVHVGLNVSSDGLVP